MNIPSNTITQMQPSTPHLTQTSILQQFINDPRTVSMLNIHRKSNIRVHQAVLVKRGNIIAEAKNIYGTRSRGSGYSDASLHAEKHVVKQLGDISKLNGADMYVMRFSRGKEGELVESKPCDSCMIFLHKCMREYGLKNVYYTCE